MVGVGDNVFTFFVAQLNLGYEEVLKHLLHTRHISTRGGAQGNYPSVSTSSVEFPGKMKDLEGTR